MSKSNCPPKMKTWGLGEGKLPLTDDPENPIKPFSTLDDDEDDVKPEFHRT